GVGKTTGILRDGAHERLEGRRAGDLKKYGPGRYDVRAWGALEPGKEFPVDGLADPPAREDETAGAWSAEGLVRGGGRNVRESDRGRMQPRSDEPRDVSDVGKEPCADLA